MQVPEAPDLQHAFASVCNEAGDRSTALLHMEKAVQLAPQNTTYMTDYVRLLIVEGQKGRARKAVRSAKVAKAEKNRLLDLIQGKSTPRRQSLGGASKAQMAKVRSLLNSGQADEALPLLDQMIDQNPDIAMLHNLRGFARFDTQGVVAAEESFRAALLLDPDFVEAKSNLGFALSRQGRDLEAINLLADVVAGNPGNLSAKINLASAWSRIEQPEKAQILIDEVLQKTPQDVDALKIQARVHVQARRFEVALPILATLADLEKQAFALQDLHALALDGSAGAEAAIAYLEGQDSLDEVATVQHAVLLGQTGELERARTLLRRHLAANPGNARAYRQLGLLQKWQREDALLNPMRALFETSSLLPEAQAELGSAYAKALDDLGDGASSFAVLVKSNAPLRRALAYDPTQTRQYFENIATQWPVKNIGTMTEAPVMQSQPIFIVGLPRSGSTLVEQILARHRDVRDLGEDPTVFVLARQAESADTKGQGQLASKIAACLNKAGQNSAFVTDKFLGNFQHLGLLADALPEARFCYMQRDLRDVGLSIYQNYFSPWEHPYALDLGHIADYMIATDRLMAHWQARLGDRLTYVSYEALTQNPEAETRTLIAALGLDWQDSCLSPQDSNRRVKTLSVGQVRRPIHNRARGRWKTHAEHLSPMIEKLAAAGLYRRYGA